MLVTHTLSLDATQPMLVQYAKTTREQDSLMWTERTELSAWQLRVQQMRSSGHMCTGLGGELRPANHIERRVMEAAKLGFSHIIVPEIHAPAATGRLANIDIIKCRTIKDALMVRQEHLAFQNVSPVFDWPATSCRNAPETLAVALQFTPGPTQHHGVLALVPRSAQKHLGSASMHLESAFT